jgi:HPt (histidine-containing phosphotransfer) domain-containing protein
MNQDTSIPPPSSEGGKNSATAELNVPVNLPGIDITAGLRMCNSSVKLYLDMLQKFRISKRREGEIIRALFASGDRETATRTAHSLKSVSATLGAAELSTAARLLEEAISKNMDDQLAERLNCFDQNLAALLTTLDAEFGEKSTSATLPEQNSRAGECDHEALKKLIKSLDDALDSDMRLAINLAAEMNNLAATPGLKQINEEFQQHLASFDIDAARASLNKAVEFINK